MATTYSSTAPPCATDDVRDGHLLDLFISHKDEAAFAELVRRHGRMVLGVCQRVLENPHDAEDCFQAAFLVLVRKATTIQPREMVGNWLYGVAYRTALEAKKMAARRRNRERKRFDMALPGIDNDADANRWQDLQPLLDEEMNRLPDKYRFVLIACDIEGRTRRDVAQSLSLPEGTVASRLARARTMLAKRLTRRNHVITAGMIAILLADNASASVPPSLAASTTNAAARLASGKSVAGLVNGNALSLVNNMLRSMLVAKLKIVSAAMAVLFVLALGLSALLPSANAHKRLDKQATLPVEAKKTKPVAIGDCVLHAVDRINRRIQALGYDAAGGGFRPHDLAVAPDAVIRIDGQDGAFDELDGQVGSSIYLEVVTGANGVATAVRIEVGQAPLEGVVQAFNESSLTIQTIKEPEGRKLDIEQTTWFLVNGKKAKVGDLKAKMKVAVNVSVKKPAVIAVQSKGTKMEGKLEAIDIDRRTLSLGTNRLDLAADAVVIINGKASRFTDLRAGMQVTLEMADDVERHQVVAITANGK